MASVIYIADPMCSWCYGFGPELSALLEALPGLQADVVLGGLRAYNTQPMDDALKTELLSHWQQVAQRTGLPFDEQALAQPGFVYNTEPACRAVVAARLLAPTKTLPVFHAIQQAFYAEGRDVTRGDVLAEVGAAALSAAGVPTDAATFAATWNSEAAITATHEDFLQTKRWGVTGFPTVVLERDGELDLVTTGYVAMPRLVELMQNVIDRTPATPTA